MNSKRKHFKMACLASVAVLLGACSNTSEVKPTEVSKVVKPAAKMVVAAAKPVKPVKAAAVVAKKAPVKTAVVVAKKAPVRAVVKRYTPPAKPRVVKPRVVAKAPVRKVYTRPKAYVPPKPIVVAVHRAPVVVKKVAAKPVVRQVTRPKPVVARAPVVRRPAAPKRAVVAKKAPAPRVYRAPAPQIRPATVPTRVASRPVYVAPKRTQARARVQQASYRPAPKPQRIVRAAPQRRAPVAQYSQSRLTGDFAGNRLAEAFINKMVAQHGFNRSYVTGVMSKAKATAWLKKKAYADANPNPKKRGLTPSWSRYRSRFITSKHINTGTAFYKKYSRSLERAASQYGVPSEYILGIMGVETIYGGNVGTDRALDALATMSFMNSRRGSYFASELEAYLLMTRQAGLDPTQPKASYAGALGLPQFMPSNIKKYGVDYDGDGAVNLWTPHDAIGSIANYLNKHGWKRGEIAAIPAKRTGGRGYSSLNWGFKHRYSLSTLSKKGLAPTYPGVSGSVHMLKLKTNSGHDYWIGGNNFYTITRYNHSSFYAMAVHELAQKIRGRVKPGRALPRVIEASADQNLLMQAANHLL